MLHSVSAAALCITALIDKSPNINDCVNQFLSCGDINALDWSPEKVDKARFHSIIAASNENDPSRALSYAFKGEQPVISVEHCCFDGIYNKIKEFCVSVGALLPQQ
ncbi:hypothetical protein [Halothiobacillus neapolitanus]|uniref:hypothetical protein n=1 Tax=Halothiobacillus neapolitanus TaxID=927 RepID=UPI0012DE45B1|nr:hypothetical protein [Halothiobacillus neapolitanus]